MSIGNVYHSQGKYNEAMSYYEQALKIYDREFGVNHINSAPTIMNMGLLLKAEGQVMLAKEELLRAYNIFENNLGEHHPNTQKARSQAHNIDIDSGGKRLIRLEIQKEENILMRLKRGR